jgi:hypothetical protein
VPADPSPGGIFGKENVLEIRGMQAGKASRALPQWEQEFRHVLRPLQFHSVEVVLPAEGENPSVALIPPELERLESKVRKPLHQIALLIRREEVGTISEPLRQGRGSLEEVGLVVVHGNVRSPVWH